MKLKARVRQGQPVFRVEIEGVDGHYFLYSFAGEGPSVGDTWHVTLEEAKRQAQFQFGIESSDWRPLIRIWDHDIMAKGTKVNGVSAVPDSAQRPDESKPEYFLRMLLRDLQALAADPDIMLRAYDPRICAIDDLVNELSCFLEWSQKSLQPGLLREDFLDPVRRVDSAIDELSKRRNPNCWTKDALRTLPEWAEIRRLAKDALASMGFELEPPPPFSM